MCQIDDFPCRTSDKALGPTSFPVSVPEKINAPPREDGNQKKKQS